ncbi:MAG: PilZ domain-containing protein, partial [Deltaproteobacteria bacterium]|nr:PilZ domain-containing protein [Deltaproteobacteria bacterium]
MSISNLSRQFVLEKGEQVETEKRRFRRFIAQDMAFAVFRPHFTKLGKIKDISRGGMAFEYVTFEGAKEDSGEIDLFVSGARFHLSRMPAQTVYDSGVADNHYTFSPFVERRRCAVQFGELTQEQTTQLNHFLETHTTG